MAGLYSCVIYTECQGLICNLLCLTLSVKGWSVIMSHALSGIHWSVILSEL